MRGGTVVCKVCCRQFAKYTCPKCNVAYCSLPCYRTHGASCTERFYKSQVEEDLKNVRVPAKERQKTAALLQRVYDLDPASTSDEEELTAPEAARLREICDGDGDVEGSLPTSLLTSFRRQLQVGFSPDVLPAFRPWWEAPGVATLQLSATGMALIASVHDPVHRLSDFPLPPQEAIPPLSSLLKGAPSVTIPWQLLEVLLVYCYVLRRYHGEWEWDVGQVAALWTASCSAFDRLRPPAETAKAAISSYLTPPSPERKTSRPSWRSEESASFSL